jgi:hypothetical protein
LAPKATGMQPTRTGIESNPSGLSRDRSPDRLARHSYCDTPTDA